MVIYFSGTGNSRYAAQGIAAGTGDSLLDAATYIRETRPAELHSDRPWIFVGPTYAWRLPRVFTSFLRDARLSGSREAYFLLTCGASMGNAAAHNRRLCAELGLTYRGTASLVMPENYIAMFQAPAPAEAQAIRERSAPKLAAVTARIRDGLPLAEESVSLIGRFYTGPVNRLFYSKIIKADPFHTTAACTGCGLCQTRCPLANIRLEAGRPAWGRNCTHCMACICSCPVQAIEYGKASQGKHRYLCPEYKESTL